MATSVTLVMTDHFHRGNDHHNLPHDHELCQYELCLLILPPKYLKSVWSSSPTCHPSSHTQCSQQVLTHPSKCSDWQLSPEYFSNFKHESIPPNMFTHLAIKMFSHQNVPPPRHQNVHSPRHQNVLPSDAEDCSALRSHSHPAQDQGAALSEPYIWFL